MADGTRAQVTLKETVRCETEEALESRFTAIEGLVADQNQKFDKHLAKMFDAIRLLSAIHNLSGEKQHYDRNSPIAASTSDLGFTTTDRDKMVKSGTQNPYAGLTRLGKDDFPRFDGDKIRAWLFKVEEFFEIAGTPNDLKIGLASAHFDGLAATWHQSFVQSKLGNDIHDWNTYKMLLEGRFEEVLGDPIAELKQLRETNGIAEYHTKFELLRTRVNLTEDEMVRLFLDGLQPETQVNVKMFQPQTVSQCLLIGRLYEQAHPKMVSNQSQPGSKWSGYDNELKGLLDCEEDQLSRDDNELVNIEVTVSTDLLLSEERDSSPQIAIGYELEAGETDTSIDQNQLIQKEAKNHSIDSFHETSLLHHKNSLLKHQVLISHLAFNNRSSIGSLDVFDDWPSAIVRTHQSQSNFVLEYAAINAYQVCDSMSLGTKLLTNGRRKTFLKTWWFKFKYMVQPRELIEEKQVVQGAKMTRNQLRSLIRIVDDLHSDCGSDIVCVQYLASSVVVGDLQETQWLFNDELKDIQKFQIVIKEGINSYACQEFNGICLRSHILHQQKKPSKSPKSWKFKFKIRSDDTDFVFKMDHWCRASYVNLETKLFLEIGDYVYVKLQPYRQNSVVLRVNQKLSPKYYGPCKVIDKCGEVAYKLELPSSSLIHPVFHVSQLKVLVGNDSTSTQFPTLLQETLRKKPEKVLKRMMVNRYEQFHMLEHANREAQSFPILNFAEEQPLLWVHNSSEQILIVSELESMRLLLYLGFHNKSLKTAYSSGEVRSDFVNSLSDALIEAKFAKTMEEYSKYHLVSTLACELFHSPRPPELFVAERMIVTKVEMEEDRNKDDQKQQGDWDHNSLLVVAAYWATQMLFGSKSNLVWHRWKMRLMKKLPGNSS